MIKRRQKLQTQYKQGDDSVADGSLFVVILVISKYLVFGPDFVIKVFMSFLVLQSSR